MFIFTLAGSDWNEIINSRVRKKLPQEALYNRSPREELGQKITPSNGDFLLSSFERGHSVVYYHICMHRQYATYIKQDAIITIR